MGASATANRTVNPELATPIIERVGIDVEQVGDPYRGAVFFARILDLPRSEWDDGISFGDTYLDAAMICYVVSVFGEEAGHKLIWDDGTPRYEPYE